MKKILIQILLLQLFISFAFTQGKIKGYVFDSETRKPLPNANVYVENLALGSATDQKGYFEINNVPAGRINVVASFIGYAKQKKDS
ncbi:CarboxypepD_reg-like domain-containing protein [Candidatus Kryptonium thompsonii]|nr:CarboxypepD_reg-like domain-containing protein [Candidatus Kryptonium thompsoni]